LLVANKQEDIEYFMRQCAASVSLTLSELPSAGGLYGSPCSFNEYKMGGADAEQDTGFTETLSVTELTCG